MIDTTGSLRHRRCLVGAVDFRRCRAQLRAVAATALCLLAMSSRAQARSPAGEVEDPLLVELEQGEALSSFPDPFEAANRHVLCFNRGLDDFLIDPITRAYQFILPYPLRRSVRNFFDNLDTPVVLVNDVLQLEWHDAGVTTGRFLLNTTLGIGGLFDPSTYIGVPGHHSDFGETMAVYGTPSGPYLVLPLIGPTTVRDGFGTLVHFLFRPTTYLLGPADQLFYGVIYGGGSGLVERDEHEQALRALEESSVDYYAALRNAYYQTRSAQIRAKLQEHAGGRRPGH